MPPGTRRATRRRLPPSPRSCLLGDRRGFDGFFGVGRLATAVLGIAVLPERQRLGFAPRRELSLADCDTFPVSARYCRNCCKRCWVSLCFFKCGGLAWPLSATKRDYTLDHKSRFVKLKMRFSVITGTMLIHPKATRFVILPAAA